MRGDGCGACLGDAVGDGGWSVAELVKWSVERGIDAVLGPGVGGTTIDVVDPVR